MDVATNSSMKYAQKFKCHRGAVAGFLGAFLLGQLLLESVWASGDEEDLLDPVSVYAVDGDALRWVEGEEELETDSTLWSRVRSLLPQSGLARVVEFHVFSDGADETLAYVAQTESDPAQWVFAVDYVDAVDLTAGEWVSTLVHEYAHVITLSDEQLDLDAESCGLSYEVDEGCALPASWLQQWYDAFWRGELVAEHQRDVGDSEANPDALDAFYDKHELDFVNAYAASNPVEDFAESFAYFVLMDLVQSADSVTDSKIQFFQAYPRLLDARTHIRANTTVRRAAIDAPPE